MQQILGLLSKHNSKIDSLTLVCLLQGCVNQNALPEGRAIHAYLVKTGTQGNVFVWTALVDMYAKVGDMEEACKVFDMLAERRLATWNSMIAGYAKRGLSNRASQLFNQLVNGAMHPDSCTVISMIQLCVAMRDLEWGRRLHFYIVWCKFDANILLIGALADMYGKCGSLWDVKHLVLTEKTKNSCLWNAVISGYALAGLYEQSLLHFCHMIWHEVLPDDSSFLSMLNVCASLGILSYGRIIHSMIVEAMSEPNIDLVNTVIDMYGKCGCVDGALHVFRCMHERNAASWNSVIAGLARGGYGDQALQMVLFLEQHGIEMDSITFVESIHSCSHAGLVAIGIFIAIMTRKHCHAIVEQDVYASLIDLLGRTGRLDEAFFVICHFPFQPFSATWRSLLSSCKIHANVRGAQQAVYFLLALEPQSDAAYLLFYNVSTADRFSSMIGD